MTSINTNLDTDFFLQGTVDTFIKTPKPNQEAIDRSKDYSSDKVDSKESKEPRNTVEQEEDTQFEENLQDKKEKLREARVKDPVKTFKKKLEAVNELVNCLMPIDQTADQNLEAQNLTEINLEDPVNLAAVVELKNSLDQRIESLVKDIASIDLSQPDGIQKILDMSNQVEALNQVESKISELLKQFDNTKLDEIQAGLEPEAKLLLETKIDSYVEVAIDRVASSKESSIAESTELSLGDLDKELLEQVTTEHASNNSNQEQGSNNFDENKFFMDFKMNIAPMSQTTSSVQLKHEVVNINKLDTFIHSKIQKLPNEAKESLSLILTPENFGQVKLSIVKVGLKLEIEIQLSNRDTLESTQSKLNDLHAVLKEKGYDTEIKVTVDNSASTNQDSANNQANYYNEAKDEQKDKYLNTSPAWLKTSESHQEASFEDALGGILN